MDRARRIALGTLIGTLGTSPWTNMGWFYSNIVLTSPTSFQDSTHFNFPLLEVSFSVPVFHELPSQLDHFKNLAIPFDSPNPENLWSNFTLMFV